MARSRLLEAIADSAAQVVVLVAPGGFGKTTLLQQATAGRDDVTWVAASGPGVEALSHDLIAAVEPRALRSLSSVLGQDATPATVAAWILNRLRKARGTIVVDDIHRLGPDPAAWALLEALVDGTQQRIRWLLASRESPQLPLTSWMAQGRMMLPLGADDLALQDDEVAELASDLGLTIGASDLRIIHSDTEGWPLGVRLALDLWSRRGRHAGIRAGTRAALHDFLETEIWQRLSGPERELITALSCIPTCTGSILEEAGFAAAPAMLRALEGRVPFVHRHGLDTWTIHDLFREFAVDRLARDDAPPRRQTLLHLAAVLARRGRAADALPLLGLADGPDEIAALLAEAGLELLETGNRPAVAGAIAALEAHGRKEDPVVHAMRGAMSAIDGSAANAASFFATALDAGVPAVLRAGVAQQLVALYLNRGHIEQAIELIAPTLEDAELGRDDQATVACLAALAYAAGGKSVESRHWIGASVERLRVVSPAVRARGLQRLGSAAWYLGDFHRAEAFSKDAVALGEEIGWPLPVATAFLTLFATASIVDPNHLRALAFARSLSDAAERAGHPALRVIGLRAVFTLSAEAGAFAQADAAAAAADAVADARTHRDELFVRQARAVMTAARGNIARAVRLLESLPESVVEGERSVRAALLALLLLLDGKNDAALLYAAAKPSAAVAGDYSSRQTSAQASVLRALVLWALDRPAMARRAALVDVASLGERDRIFVVALSRLIQLPHPLPNASAAAGALAEMTDAGFGTYALIIEQLIHRDAGKVVLSPAELDVLRDFARFGGREADVAQRLGRAPGTVHTQVRSAVRKLGCSGRAEALAYARAQGWL